jgi:hypothetical protein
MTGQIGDVLRCWRAVRSLGIREAAQIIGTSSATLSRIENGKSVDGKTIILLF